MLKLFFLISILTASTHLYSQKSLQEKDKAVYTSNPNVLNISKDDELYKKIVRETGLFADYDITGSIGKRYRRQDEIGTPKCLTVDFGTIGEDPLQGEKDTVTIRDRDTQKQERLPIHVLIEKLKNR